MKRADIDWNKIPKQPGVYFFYGTQKKIFYIGKATELRQRIKSYFDAEVREKRSALIEKMVYEATAVEYVTTDSVLEAMLLETNLIRTHKPKFNTKSKDDKSYNHVVITNDEFPRVLVVRGKDLLQKGSEYKYIFGPFPNGALFKEALKIIRKLFQFYDSAAPKLNTASSIHKGKIDFNRQIGLYPDVCTKSEYAKTIRHIVLFFEGKKKKIISDLEKMMLSYAKKEQFEEANSIKRKIFSLNHIQDVSLLKEEARTYLDDRIIRIEGYDIAHLQGSNMVGVMVVAENELIDTSKYRTFTIRSTKKPDDTKALSEVLERRLAHTEWVYPNYIVADGGMAQIRALEKVLKKHSLEIPVIGVVKDKTHKPIKILGPKFITDTYKKIILLVNAESHRFAIKNHRKKRFLI